MKGRKKIVIMNITQHLGDLNAFSIRVVVISNKPLLLNSCSNNNNKQ